MEKVGALARIVAAKVEEVIKPVLMGRGGDEREQAGEIGGNLERTEISGLFGLQPRTKAILEQSDGQQFG